jgi:RNA polymerase sigma-70 factor, ECF subfamily
MNGAGNHGRAGRAVGRTWLDERFLMTSCNGRFRDKQTLDGLMPLVYTELQKVAGGYLRNERTGQAFQPAALVHEAYVRLVKQDQPDYQSPSHFVAVAAQVMRQVLIDRARVQNAAKRGCGAATLSMAQAGDIAIERPRVLSAVEDALEELGRQDAGKAQLVKMRFYGGFTAEESAQATGRPVAEVRRHLRVAQAWLERELVGRSEAAPQRVDGKGQERPASQGSREAQRQFAPTCRYARTVSVWRMQLGGAVAS